MAVRAVSGRPDAHATAAEQFICHEQDLSQQGLRRRQGVTAELASRVARYLAPDARVSVRSALSQRIAS